MMENQEIQTLRNGEIIFMQGRLSSCMYDLLEGRVGIYVNYGSDQEKKLTELEPGACFGEVGLLEYYPRSATAVALADDTRVAVITKESFGKYFYDHEDKILALMHQMSVRIRELTEDYDEVCRTIAENMKAGGLAEKGKWLVSHLKKFAQASGNAGWSGAGLWTASSSREAVKPSAEVPVNSTLRTCKKNEVIFRQGDTEPCMYEVKHGSVNIYINYGTSVQKLLVTLEESKFFGEMGLIDSLPRSATAVAAESGTIIEVITAEGLSAYYKKYPAKVLDIMQNMSHRLRELTRTYELACKTVADVVSAEEKGEAQGDELRERQIRFAAVYDESRKAAEASAQEKV